MFLVMCLPRSRSAWLAHYLNYPLARPLQPVGHEILTECETVERFLESYRAGMWGSVETAGAMLWRIMRSELPTCKLVLVRRPLIDVHRSLARAGVVADLSALAEMDVMLDMAATDPSVISLPFEVLSEPFVGQWLFEHLLELEWDRAWWEQMIATNVQVDMPAWIARINGKRASFHDLMMDVCRRTDLIAQPRHMH